MPKMKTNSSAKKRFKLTASGKVRGTPPGKNHFRRNRSHRMIRDSRGMMVLSDHDALIITRLLPNS